MRTNTSPKAITICFLIIMGIPLLALLWLSQFTPSITKLEPRQASTQRQTAMPNWLYMQARIEKRLKNMNFRGKTIMDMYEDGSSDSLSESERIWKCFGFIRQKGQGHMMVSRFSITYGMPEDDAAINNSQFRPHDKNSG
jgi:hypothetical protein